MRFKRVRRIATITYCYVAVLVTGLVLIAKMLDGDSDGEEDR